MSLGAVSAVVASLVRCADRVHAMRDDLKAVFGPSKGRKVAEIVARCGHWMGDARTRALARASRLRPHQAGQTPHSALRTNVDIHVT